MAFPLAVVRRKVTFGIPFGLADGENLIMRVVFTPTRSMVWAATGSPGIAREYTAASLEGLQGEVMLPVTDQDGWLDGAGNALSIANGAQTHGYAVQTSYETLSGRTVSTLPVKNIVLPADNLSDVDLDVMLPVTTVAGVSILIPDLWSQQLTAAQAAVDAMVSTYVTWDGTNLRLNGEVIDIGSSSPAVPDGALITDAGDYLVTDTGDYLVAT